jgi:hypothetical protein
MIAFVHGYDEHLSIMDECPYVGWMAFVHG